MSPRRRSEVHVDVSIDTLRSNRLEQQPVLDRIKPVIPSCPRDDEPATPTWPTECPFGAYRNDQLRSAEEAARKAHLAHHPRPVLRPFAVVPALADP